MLHFFGRMKFVELHVKLSGENVKISVWFNLPITKNEWYFNLPLIKEYVFSAVFATWSSVCFLLSVKQWRLHSGTQETKGKYFKETFVIFCVLMVTDKKVWSVIAFVIYTSPFLRFDIQRNVLHSATNVFQIPAMISLS